MLRTTSVKAIARYLLGKPDEATWCGEVVEGTGQLSGTTFKILERFFEEGWLTDFREDPASAYGRISRRVMRAPRLLQRAELDV